MLSKEYRLETRFIPVIAKKGKRISSELFDLKILESQNNKNPKFVFIVSKKVHKSSVKRNRIKRIFRAAIRDLTKVNYFEISNYMFFIKSPNLVSMSKRDLQDYIVNLKIT